MKDLSQMSHRRIRCTIRITQKDVVKGHSFGPSAARFLRASHQPIQLVLECTTHLNKTQN